MEQQKNSKKKIIDENVILKPKRLNEVLSDLMGKLATIMAKKGEQFKARAYKKAEETIMSFNTDITNIEQLKGKPGIGETIMEKLKEYIETGKLKLIERERENPENILTDVYGIGPKKAKQLVEKGIKSISELREKQGEVLNDIQKIGLKYYEDILERIPRSEINEYNEIFQESFNKVREQDSKYEIVGSYRRGLKTSGDIDVIITSINYQMFSNFLDNLIEQKIIIEVLSRGKTKCLVITKIPNGKYARRVDFLYTTPEEYPFSVLYFTGSKAFNTVMRGHALKMGFSLNEHQMSKMVDKKKEEKVSHNFKNERDIFDFLNLKYKEPSERIDGRYIEKKDGTQVEIIIPFQEEPKVEKTKKIREPNAEKTKKVREPKVKKNDIKAELAITMQKLQECESNKHSVSQSKENEIIIGSKILVKQKELKTKKVREPSENKTMKKREPNKKKGTLVIIEQFKEKGISVLEPLQETELSNIIIETNKAYYNQKPLLTDNEYDIIKEYVERKYPNNEAIAKVGAPIEKNKVELPYEMPSMDKIKPDTNALSTWMLKYKSPYVLSCKLDGVSGMYSTEGDKPKLYTRGDGKVGQDISHLIKVLELPNHKDTVVRGEFIIPKAVFDEKYKEKFANPRNLVSGIINSKTLDDKVKDLHFVAYEVIKPLVKPSEQMKTLMELRHEVVMNKTIDELSNEILSETLLDWRKNYDYEIDGVIVIEDKVHPRISGNPEYAFAFKMVISDQMAEAKVVDVIWSASKSGYLKPRVQIEPIKLGGVTIEYATGFNGKFIEDNKIGIGAVIQIIRSGDVIPYIKSITSPADKAKMPDVPYHWTDTHVDIVLENVADDITVREKNITAFFVELEVDGLSGGNVKRIMKAGYDTIPKILKMSKMDFEKVEGFKEKMINKVQEGIKEKIASADLLKIMVASNMLGRGLGERKIKPILEKFPSILTTQESNEEKITMLKTIDGIGPENAKSFVANIPAFLNFLKECELEYKLNTTKSSLTNTLRETSVNENQDTSNKLYGKKIVMTKVRDKEIIEHVKKVGGILEDNMKKDIFVLIVKSHEGVSNKTKYASENNIQIMTPEEFKEKYMI
jgi:DNA ligase (NAD+)